MAEHIEHKVHDNGIHEVIFLIADHEVVDRYMNLMEALIEKIIDSDSPQKLSILLDMTRTLDLPPFSYITRQGRKLLHDHLKGRDKLHLRTAFLARHDELLVLSLAENFFKLLPVDIHMRVFEAGQREQAISWLLAEE